MLKPELLAELTPESLSGLDPKDKQRVLEILQDLELTGYQRYMRDLKATQRKWLQELSAQGVEPHQTIQYAEIIAKVRKKLDERQRRNDPTWGMTPAEKLREALYNAPDHQEFLARQKREAEEQAAARMEDCRQAQARFVEKTKEEAPAVEVPIAEQESTPIPVPRVLTAAEWARRESDRVQREAEQFQRTDFLTRVCGTGSDKPSGKGNRRWDA
jgi:hypothetical protein